VNLKPETLEKLRVLLKEDWGQEVDDQELHEIAFNLLGYYDTLLQCYCEDNVPVEAVANQHDYEPERQKA
jgi:hypothetical protein